MHERVQTPCFRKVQTIVLCTSTQLYDITNSALKDHSAYHTLETELGHPVDVGADKIDSFKWYRTQSCEFCVILTVYISFSCLRYVLLRRFTSYIRGMLFIFYRYLTLYVISATLLDPSTVGCISECLHRAAASLVIHNKACNAG